MTDFKEKIRIKEQVKSRLNLIHKVYWVILNKSYQKILSKNFTRLITMRYLETVGKTNNVLPDVLFYINFFS